MTIACCPPRRSCAGPRHRPHIPHIPHIPARIEIQKLLKDLHNLRAMRVDKTLQAIKMRAEMISRTRNRLRELGVDPDHPHRQDGSIRLKR